MGVRRKIIMSKRLKTEQVELQLEMQSKGLNIVSCGNCGTILIHKVGKENIVCHDCGEHMSLSDCPDVYYEGMPHSLPIDDGIDRSDEAREIQRDAIDRWINRNSNEDFIFYE